MNNIDLFIDFLANIETPDKMSLNIYKGDKVAPAMRRESLRFYLKKMQQLNPSIIFVGEAPGRHGCFHTGVPFTDEHNLLYNPFFEEYECRMLQDIIDIEPDYKPYREATASVVWSCLNKISFNDFPLLWNIYPFHPSTIENNCLIADDRPNRAPTVIECNMGKEILIRLLSCYEIKTIIAVGRWAENILKKDFPNIQYIRHPSRGGASKFSEAFGLLYHIK